MNGHLVSSFAMGAMVDYIKNSKRFKEQREQDFEEYSDEDMEKIMRKAFRYAQDKVKD